jgi:hypothetical protein
LTHKRSVNFFFSCFIICKLAFDVHNINILYVTPMAGDQCDPKNGADDTSGLQSDEFISAIIHPNPALMFPDRPG